VLKPSAATPHLMVHRGRAVVFEDIDDYKEDRGRGAGYRRTCVMVLKNCGPRGYPGMAEVGNMGLPPKVLRKGITDMVRISDARMSGTAYGTVVLHTSARSGGWRAAGHRARRRHSSSSTCRTASCISTSHRPRSSGG
jgi:dihydroxy-acid dehydratase